MRRMSFALTTEQVLARQKTVTRRLAHTWATLKPGDLLLAVDKAMGLKKGEKSRVLAVVRVTDVRVEPLMSAMTPAECEAEGFPNISPQGFIDIFLKSYGINDPHYTFQVRRIAFEYVTGSAEVAALGEANQRKAGARKSRERKVCGGTLEYLSIMGSRLYTIVDDVRRYQHRCERCGMSGVSDGQAKTCERVIRRAS